MKNKIAIIVLSLIIMGILFGLYFNIYLCETKIVNQEVVFSEIEAYMGYTYNIYDLEDNLLARSNRISIYVPTKSKVLARMEKKYKIRDYFYNKIKPELISIDVLDVKIIEVGDKNSYPKVQNRYNGKQHIYDYTIGE